VNDSKNAQRILVLAVLLGVPGLTFPGLAAAQSDADAGVPSESSSTAPSEPPATTPPSEPPATTSQTSDTYADGTTQTTTTTTPTSDAAALADGTTVTTTTTSPDGTTQTDETTVAATGNADEAAEEVQSAREPLAWRNSFFNYSVNASFCSFSRDCQLSYNPTVYQFISLAPRWYVDNDTFFSFSIYALQEWTQDDGATYQNEFQMFDGRISLTHRFALGDNFMILPAAGFWMPFSKSSQAAQRYLRVGGGVSATWVPGVAGFNLSILGSYYRWLGGSNVPATSSPYPACTGDGCSGQGLGGSAAAGASSGGATGGPQDVSNQANGTTNEVDRITAGLIANWQPFDGAPFTITLQIFYYWANGYNVAPSTLNVGGTPITLPDNSSHWRAYDSYSIYFQYDFVPWLQGWIGFSNSTQLAAVFNPDGSARSPVNLYDMQVAIGTTIQLDSLYESFAAADEDDGLTPEQRQRRRQGLASRSSSGGSL